MLALTFTSHGYIFLTLDKKYLIGHYSVYVRCANVTHFTISCHGCTRHHVRHKIAGYTSNVDNCPTTLTIELIRKWHHCHHVYILLTTESIRKWHHCLHVYISLTTESIRKWCHCLHVCISLTTESIRKWCHCLHVCISLLVATKLNGVTHDFVYRSCTEMKPIWQEHLLEIQ